MKREDQTLRSVALYSGTFNNKYKPIIPSSAQQVYEIYIPIQNTISEEECRNKKNVYENKFSGRTESKKRNP
jgi:hypothetical protein